MQSKTKKKNISPNLITDLDSGNYINTKSTELGQFEVGLKHWLVVINSQFSNEVIP